MTSGRSALEPELEQRIKDEARRLGFILAGFTTPDPPPHVSVFEDWLRRGRHASMGYLAEARSRLRRADPRVIVPESKSILMLAAPYSNPVRLADTGPGAEAEGPRGRIAAYAWGDDYHQVFSERLETLTGFIELQVGHPVIHRYYTDTGPLLERDLAQRAGLGWIGKNTCLIHPKHGSYFLLAEVLLDLEITIDTPLNADHCGTCTRCIEACPTECILPDRTLDSGRCISYLTIESREAIPAELRPLIGEWIFGCDICQMVCPWNRFAAEEGDAAFRPRDRSTRPELMEQLRLTPSEYSREFKTRAVRRAKHRDYRRNVLVAIGNAGDSRSIPALRAAAGGSDPLIREHAAWALQRIAEGAGKSDE